MPCGGPGSPQTPSQLELSRTLLSPWEGHIIQSSKNTVVGVPNKDRTPGKKIGL